ncbi:MAG: mercuric transporter MerT family protein, partial [Anaerolineales bacterium]
MKSRFGSLVSTLAAALSASCCVLPVVLLVLGFTSLGPFAVLMRYRPITLTFSYLMLAGAFYVVYRPQAKADCAAGVCSLQKLRRQRWIVWISAGLML